MARAKVKLRLHRTAIVLFCLTLLVALIQGVSYFSLNHQVARSEQVEDIAQALTNQVAYSLQPLMENSDSQTNTQKMQAMLENLAKQPRILDAAVYDVNGSMLVYSGEKISVRDRLSLDGKRPGSYFNNQLVTMIQGNDGPLGFLRLTLDTHVLATESKQVDNTSNMLRLMLLVALAIGMILAHTLLQHRNSRWRQSPYLLTANTPVDDDGDNGDENDIDEGADKIEAEPLQNTPRRTRKPNTVGASVQDYQPEQAAKPVPKKEPKPRVKKTVIQDEATKPTLEEDSSPEPVQKKEPKPRVKKAVIQDEAIKPVLVEDSSPEPVQKKEPRPRLKKPVIQDEATKPTLEEDSSPAPSQESKPGLNANLRRNKKEAPTDASVEKPSPPQLQVVTRPRKVRTPMVTPYDESDDPNKDSKK